MKKEDVETLKNWRQDKSPVRAYRWAMFMKPIRWPETWDGMTEKQIRMSNQDSYNSPNKIMDWERYVYTNRKQYWQFLKDHNLQPTMYDLSLGDYKRWLATEAL